MDIWSIFRPPRNGAQPAHQYSNVLRLRGQSSDPFKLAYPRDSIVHYDLDLAGMQPACKSSIHAMRLHPRAGIIHCSKYEAVTTADRRYCWMRIGMCACHFPCPELHARRKLLESLQRVPATGSDMHIFGTMVNASPSVLTRAYCAFRTWHDIVTIHRKAHPTASILDVMKTPLTAVKISQRVRSHVEARYHRSKDILYGISFCSDFLGGAKVACVSNAAS